MSGARIFLGGRSGVWGARIFLGRGSGVSGARIFLGGSPGDVGQARIILRGRSVLSGARIFLGGNSGDVRGHRSSCEDVRVKSAGTTTGQSLNDHGDHDRPERTDPPSLRVPSTTRGTSCTQGVGGRRGPDKSRITPTLRVSHAPWRHVCPPRMVRPPKGARPSRQQSEHNSTETRYRLSVPPTFPPILQIPWENQGHPSHLSFGLWSPPRRHRCRGPRMWSSTAVMERDGCYDALRTATALHNRHRAPHPGV